MSDNTEHELEDLNLGHIDYPERIPHFATEEEARDFWDTHDSSPSLDQMEDVTNSPPPELRRGPGRAGSTARRRPPEGRMDLVSLRVAGRTRKDHLGPSHGAGRAEVL